MLQFQVQQSNWCSEELIITKWIFLSLFSLTALAQTTPVKKVYLENNSKLPNNYFLELSRVVLHSPHHRFIPGYTPKDKKESEQALKYHVNKNKIVITYGEKVVSVAKSKNPGTNQKNIREASYKLINGEEQYNSVKNEKWFNTNFPQPKVAKKKKKPTPAPKPIVIAEEKKEKKIKTSKIEKSALKDLDDKIDLKKIGAEFVEFFNDMQLIIGATQYWDNNSQYFQDELKQSLGIEFGVSKGKIKVTYENRFLNLVKENEKVLEVRHSLINVRYPLFGFTDFVSYTKVAYGKYTYSDVNDNKEEGNVFVIGQEGVIKNIFRGGLQFETSPGSEFYSGVISFYIGAGWNF